MLTKTRFLKYAPEELNRGLSVVYFIQGSSGLIRIGVTSNLHRRIHEAMVGNDRRVVLVGAISGTNVLKRKLHRSFSEYYSHGEWFHPVKELVDFFFSFREPTFQEVFETLHNIGPDQREAVVNTVDMILPVAEDEVDQLALLPRVIVPVHPLV